MSTDELFLIQDIRDVIHKIFGDQPHWVCLSWTLENEALVNSVVHIPECGTSVIDQITTVFQKWFEPKNITVEHNTTCQAWYICSESSTAFYVLMFSRVYPVATLRPLSTFNSGFGLDEDWLFLPRDEAQVQSLVTQLALEFEPIFSFGYHLVPYDSPALHQQIEERKSFWQRKPIIRKAWDYLFFVGAAE